RTCRRGAGGAAGAAGGNQRRATAEHRWHGARAGGRPRRHADRTRGRGGAGGARVGPHRDARRDAGPRGAGRPPHRRRPARRMSFLALLRKELRAYFAAPLVYVVGAVFYALTGFFFYTQLVYFVQYGFGVNILGNFWTAFMAGAPYSVSMVLLLVVPLLTMRLLAEEWKLGTIELLLTYPIPAGPHAAPTPPSSPTANPP